MAIDKEAAKIESVLADIRSRNLALEKKMEDAARKRNEEVQKESLDKSRETQQPEEVKKPAEPVAPEISEMFAALDQNINLVRLASNKVEVDIRVAVDTLKTQQSDIEGISKELEALGKKIDEKKSNDAVTDIEVEDFPDGK